MLNCTLNQREDQYQNLNNFTKKTHEEIIDITSSLGWTVASINTDNDTRLVCPFDSSHRIGKNMLDRHLESCQWKNEGYDKFDTSLSEPSLSLHSPSSIKFDALLQNDILQKAKQLDSSIKVETCECRTWHKLYISFFLIIGTDERLIPQTSDRLFADFTREERKILYEHVLSRTVAPNIGHDITDTHRQKSQDKDDRKLSFLEVLVQERNLKRRRAKHRGVHTNKRSHIEILREVINQQMELYVDYMMETRASNRGTKTTNILETPSSNRHSDDATETSSLPFRECSLRRCNLFLEDSQNYRGSWKSRNDQKHERSETPYIRGSNGREKHEKCWRSATTAESWKIQKVHKPRKSHSREKRDEHWSVRQNIKDSSSKSRESEKSYNGHSSYSKYRVKN